VRLSEITSPPNLVSLSRVLLIPFIGYFLSREGNSAVIVCAILMVLAGVSDGLDGYLARRLGKVTRLGILLDPLADKLFAGALVILLILYRDLPIWLAAVIVGRDLLIVMVGGLLMRGRDLSLPSNLTGKYTFSAIAILLGSYVVHFEFGVNLFIWITLVLLLVSTVSYARVMMIVRRGGRPPVFADRPAYLVARVALSVIVLAVFLYRFYLFLWPQ